MADQQSRGGKKQGGREPDHPREHQTTHETQDRPESTKPSDQGRKPMDDPSLAPESGDRNATGNQ